MAKEDLFFQGRSRQEHYALLSAVSAREDGYDYEGDRYEEREGLVKVRRTRCLLAGGCMGSEGEYAGELQSKETE